MPTENKKKIIFFSRAPNLYGAPRCLLLLLSKLDQKKYLPVVVFPDQGPLVERVKALGIETHIIAREQPWGKLGYILKLRSFLKQQQPDLVYVNTVLYASPVIAAKLLQLPTVVHVHESKTYLGFRSNLYPILRFPAKFICISQATKQLLLDKRVPPAKISVVYDGVDLADFKPAAEARSRCRQELGLAKGQVLIGLIGQIIPRKGIADFIKAAGLVKEKERSCRFIVVGGIMDHDYFKTKVKPLCDQPDLKKSVILTGFKEDVSSYLATMDIFVSASHAEPFGLVNIEAMAMAKPVVATAVGGQPEIVIDGETGLLVPPGSAKELAAAILKLVNDPELRQRLGQAGYKRVQASFSIEQYHRGIEQVLEQMTQLSETGS